MYMCICIRRFINMCTYIYICICRYIHVYEYAGRYICICIHIYTSIYADIFMNTSFYMIVQLTCMYTHICLHRIYADVTGPVVLKDGAKKVIIRADSNWKVCVHVFMHTHTCIYICMYTYMYIYMYVCFLSFCLSLSSLSLSLSFALSRSLSLTLSASRVLFPSLSLCPPRTHGGILRAHAPFVSCHALSAHVDLWNS